MVSGWAYVWGGWRSHGRGFEPLGRSVTGNGETRANRHERKMTTKAIGGRGGCACENGRRQGHAHWDEVGEDALAGR